MCEDILKCCYRKYFAITLRSWFYVKLSHNVHYEQDDLKQWWPVSFSLFNDRNTINNTGSYYTKCAIEKIVWFFSDMVPSASYPLSIFYGL
jgi:hypothetical protein